MKIYVAYCLGTFIFSLGLAWIISRKTKWEKREIQGYNAFKANVFNRDNQKLILIPGNYSFFSAEQVIALEHCQRFLIENKNSFAHVEINILVSCPFMYEILQNYISVNNINANIDFIALEQFGFIMAAMGIMSRTQPTVAFNNSVFGVEGLMIGEACNEFGDYYLGSTHFSALADGSVSAKHLLMSEEVFALPAYENEKPVDKIFLIASDICRLIIIIIIIFGSIKATII